MTSNDPTDQNTYLINTMSLYIMRDYVYTVRYVEGHYTRKNGRACTTNELSGIHPTAASVSILCHAVK